MKFLKGFSVSRATRYGLNTLLMVLILLTILILLGIILERHEKRIDLTTTGRYSLSAQTRQVIRALKDPLTALCFFAEETPGKTSAEDLLDQYAYLSKNFHFEFIDPDRSPAKAKQHGITTYGTTVIIGPDKEEKIVTVEEETLTNAIIKVTRKGKKSIYFLQGHGEKDPTSSEPGGYASAKKALEEKNYEVKTLNLIREGKVPEDCSLLVISGPQKELFVEELKAIKTYINAGNSCFFLLDPQMETSAIENFLKDFGVTFGHDIIVDQDLRSRLFGGDYLIPLVSSYESNPITKDFTFASFFPLVRSLSLVSPPPDGVTVQALAKTGKESWAETDLELLEKGKAIYEEDKDALGPLTIGAVITYEPREAHTDEEASPPDKVTYHATKEEAKDKVKAKMVAIGDSDFANNTYLNLQGNGDLFLNAINWLAEEEDLIAIGPKPSKSTPLLLSAHQARSLFFFAVVLLPGSALASGIIVWSHRKKRT